MAGDEGLGDGLSSVDWDPSEDSVEHAKCVEAGGGDCIDLLFHGQFAVEEDA